MKTCTKCNKEKDLDKFRKHSECVNGRSNTCKECFRAWTKEYEKTQDGFLMRVYRNMKSRITGIQKAKFHLYEGKYLLTKQEFYDWAKSSDTFYTLFKTYESSNFDRKLAPSVDRINSEIGYTKENIEWVTHSENSRRGSVSQWKNGTHRKLA